MYMHGHNFYLLLTKDLCVSFMSAVSCCTRAQLKEGFNIVGMSPPRFELGTFSVNDRCGLQHTDGLKKHMLSTIFLCPLHETFSLFQWQKGVQSKEPVCEAFLSKCVFSLTQRVFWRRWLSQSWWRMASSLKTPSKQPEFGPSEKMSQSQSTILVSLTSTQ